MRNKIKNIGILILAFCILAGITGFLFRKRIAKRYLPEVEQIGVIQVKIMNDTSYIDFKLSIANKTFLKIEVDTVTHNILLFNKAYLQKQTYLGLILPANGRDTIQISLKIPFVAILKDLAKERGKGDSTSYSVQLYLHCKTIFGKSKISVNRAAKLKIPQMPELKIESIKWNKVRPKLIQAAITVKLTNHSNISLSIKDLKYNMIIDARDNLKGVYQDSIIIKPNGETLITIPVEINARILKTAIEVVTNKDKYGYTLTIDATLLTMDSLKENFRVNVINKGIVELKK